MWIRIIPLLLISLACGSSGYAYNNIMAGTGHWGGTQNCPTQKVEKLEPVEDRESLAAKRAQGDLEAAQRQLMELELEVQTSESELDQLTDDFGDSISSKYAATVLAHISTRGRCDDYSSGGSTNNGDISKNGNGFYQDDKSYTDTGSFTSSEWGRVCDPRQRGSFNAQVLCQRPYITGDSRSARTCVRNLRKIVRLTDKLDELLDDAVRAEEDIDRAEDYLKIAKKTLSQRNTEAGACEGCEVLGRVSDGGSGSSIMPALVQLGLGIGGYYLDQQRYETTRKNNAALGYPMPVNYPGGAQYLAAGVAGIANGGYQCGQMVYPGATNPHGMPTAFAYPNGPQGYYQNGAPFLPGAHPWAGHQGMPPYALGHQMGGPASLYGNLHFGNQVGNGPAAYYGNGPAALYGNGPAALYGNGPAALYGGGGPAALYGNGPAGLYGNFNLGIQQAAGGAGALYGNGPAALYGNGPAALYAGGGQAAYSPIYNPATGYGNSPLLNGGASVNYLQQQMQNEMNRARVVQGLGLEAQTLNYRLQQAMYGMNSGMSPTPGGGYYYGGGNLSGGLQLSASLGGNLFGPTTPYPTTQFPTTVNPATPTTTR